MHRVSFSKGSLVQSGLLSGNALVLAPIQGDAAAVAEATSGVEPSVAEFADQIDDGEVRTVFPLCVHVDRNVARARNVAREIHRRTSNPGGPLARDLAVPDDRLGAEAAGRVGFAWAIANRAAIDPGRVASSARLRQ